METSFYLTPELRKRLVHLTFHNTENGSSLDPFTNQMEIIEQDPTKRTPFFEKNIATSNLLMT